jgi:hypothetical protein
MRRSAGSGSQRLIRTSAAARRWQLIASERVKYRHPTARGAILHVFAQEEVTSGSCDGRDEYTVPEAARAALSSFQRCPECFDVGSSGAEDRQQVPDLRRRVMAGNDAFARCRVKELPQSLKRQYAVSPRCRDEDMERSRMPVAGTAIGSIDQHVSVERESRHRARRG